MVALDWVVRWGVQAQISLFGLLEQWLLIGMGRCRLPFSIPKALVSANLIFVLKRSHLKVGNLKKPIWSAHRQFSSRLCACGDLCLIIHQTDLQMSVILSVISHRLPHKCCHVEVLSGKSRFRDFSITPQGLLNQRPALGAAEQGRGRPEPPPTFTETRKMVSGYYGRLLWQPQVSVRATISLSVGERGRGGWREEPAEGEGWRNQ